ALAVRGGHGADTERRPLMGASDGRTAHGHEGARRVLVVEDDLAIRRLAMDLLEDEGYEVRTADSGAAALEIMETWRPSLIVLDLMMPVMDGPTFHANLPEDARDIPILVLSGSRTARET